MPPTGQEADDLHRELRDVHAGPARGRHADAKRGRLCADHDDSPIPFRDGRAKVLPIAGGWWTSSPDVAWRKAMAPVLEAQPADPDQLRAAVRAWAPGAMHELEHYHACRVEAVRDRHETIVIGAMDGHLYRLMLNWAGEDLLPGDGLCVPVVASCPAGVDRKAASQLVCAYMGRATAAPGTPASLREMAVLFRDMYRLCGADGAVSPHLAIGVVERSGQTTRRALLGPIAHDEILGWSDEELMAHYASPSVDATARDEVGERWRAYVYNGSGQAIASGSPTALTFDSEIYDIGDLHSTVTNTSRITIPKGGDTGLWVLTAQVSWPANVTGSRMIVIRRGDGGVFAKSQIPPSPGAGNKTIHSVTAFVESPAPGDYFEAVVTQDSGGSLTTDAGSSNTFFTATHGW